MRRTSLTRIRVMRSHTPASLSQWGHLMRERDDQKKSSTTSRGATNKRAAGGSPSDRPVISSRLRSLLKSDSSVAARTEAPSPVVIPSSLAAPEQMGLTRTRSRLRSNLGLEELAESSPSGGAASPAIEATPRVSSLQVLDALKELDVTRTSPAAIIEKLLQNPLIDVDAQLASKMMEMLASSLFVQQHALLLEPYRLQSEDRGLPSTATRLSMLSVTKQRVGRIIGTLMRTSSEQESVQGANVSAEVPCDTGVIRQHQLLLSLIGDVSQALRTDGGAVDPASLAATLDSFPAVRAAVLRRRNEDVSRIMDEAGEDVLGALGGIHLACAAVVDEASLDTAVELWSESLRQGIAFDTAEVEDGDTNAAAEQLREAIITSTEALLRGAARCGDMMPERKLQRVTDICKFFFRHAPLEATVDPRIDLATLAAVASAGDAEKAVLTAEALLRSTRTLQAKAKDVKPIHAKTDLTVGMKSTADAIAPEVQALYFESLWAQPNATAVAEHVVHRFEQPARISTSACNVAALVELMVRANPSSSVEDGARPFVSDVNAYSGGASDVDVAMGEEDLTSAELQLPLHRRRVAGEALSESPLGVVGLMRLMRRHSTVADEDTWALAQLETALILMEAASETAMGETQFVAVVTAVLREWRAFTANLDQIAKSTDLQLDTSPAFVIATDAVAFAVEQCVQRVSTFDNANLAESFSKELSQCALLLPTEGADPFMNVSNANRMLQAIEDTATAATGDENSKAVAALRDTIARFVSSVEGQGPSATKIQLPRRLSLSVKLACTRLDELSGDSVGANFMERMLNCTQLATPADGLRFRSNSGAQDALLAARTSADLVSWFLSEVERFAITARPSSLPTHFQSFALRAPMYLQQRAVQMSTQLTHESSEEDTPTQRQHRQRTFPSTEGHLVHTLHHLWPRSVGRKPLAAQ